MGPKKIAWADLETEISKEGMRNHRLSLMVEEPSGKAQVFNRATIRKYPEWFISMGEVNGILHESNNIRRHCRRIMESNKFDIFILLCIITSTVTMMLEDHQEPCAPLKKHLKNISGI